MQFKDLSYKGNQTRYLSQREMKEEVLCGSLKIQADEQTTDMKYPVLKHLSQLAQMRNGQHLDENAIPSFKLIARKNDPRSKRDKNEERLSKEL